MKFEPHYTPTIMDGPVVRWGSGYNRGARHNLFGDARTDWSAEISASRNGVCIGGHWPIITRREDLDDLIAQLNRAFDAHVQIARNPDAAESIAGETNS